MAHWWGEEIIITMIDHMIHMTKTGKIVTKNRKHINATLVTADQYLWDQLGKNTVDMLDDILKDFEKKTEPTKSDTIPNARDMEE